MLKLEPSEKQIPAKIASTNISKLLTLLKDFIRLWEYWVKDYGCKSSNYLVWFEKLFSWADSKPKTL